MPLVAILNSIVTRTWAARPEQSELHYHQRSLRAFGRVTSFRGQAYALAILSSSSSKSQKLFGDIDGYLANNYDLAGLIVCIYYVYPQDKLRDLRSVVVETVGGPPKDGITSQGQNFVTILAFSSNQ
jgi:hypothetical protein